MRSDAKEFLRSVGSVHNCVNSEADAPTVLEDIEQMKLPGTDAALNVMHGLDRAVLGYQAVQVLAFFGVEEAFAQNEFGTLLPLEFSGAVRTIF